MRDPSLPCVRRQSSIRIGTRHRQDLGDLKGLAASIFERGLIAPIAVDPNGLLVAGRRRLEAWRLAFGDAPVPFVTVDIDALQGEHDENTHRKALTLSEQVALMRELTPAIAAEARARRDAGKRPSGQFARKVDGIPIRTGETREIVSALLGTSARTLAKAAAVVDAAAAEPDRYGRLLKAMDRTGKVNGPHTRLVVMRQADSIRAEPPPLPSRGPYRVIAADVPWPFDPDAEDQMERGTAPYPRMTMAQIEAFGADVLSIAHDDCVLFFAVTNHHLPSAYTRILPAWGFTPKTLLTWGKDQIGRGQYLREKTEHWIVAVRGRPPFQLSAESTLLMAPRTHHSEKPAAFYDLVERVCPAPRYACLFSHLQAGRPRWDQHSSAKPAVALAAELAETAIGAVPAEARA